MRILVVDDEPLIAYDLAYHLMAAGFTVIGPSMQVAEALELLASEGCDAAVLDVNLGNNTTSEPIARELNRLAIPFVIATGYASDQHPPLFQGAPLVVKPIRTAVLIEQLRKLVP